MAARGTAAPKPAAKRKPTLADVAVPDESDGGGIPEILRFDTSSNGHDGTRIPLFSVDGKVYTIPAHPPMTLALEVQHVSADTSIPAGMAVSRANDLMMTGLLGEEGYAALRANCKTPKAFTKVITICSELLFGALEDPKDA